MRLLFFTLLALLALLAPLSFSQIIYRGSDLSEVALTFDDGPNQDYTEKVLDILKKENVKATFFVVGERAYQYPLILRDISRQGHEIGNHTYYHSRITWINNDKLLDEIKRTSDIVKKNTGKSTFYFRPPFGTVSKEKLSLIEKAGYKVVMWYGNADDFYHIGWGMRTPESITKRVISQLHGGNIILMHDDSKQTLAALPMIISEIKKRNYKFVTISELIEAKR